MRETAFVLVVDKLAKDVLNRDRDYDEFLVQLAREHYSKMTEEDLVQACYDIGLQEEDDELMEAVEKLER